MDKVDDNAWQSADLVSTFLTTIRSAVPFAQDQIDLMLQIMTVEQTAVTRVLDLGCGDGILGRSILATFPEATCVFADFSAPMLDACRAQLANAEDRAILVDLDYGQEDWPTRVAEHGPYQAIVSGYSIHHQPDDTKRRIYAQLLDLLTPGGWFLNMEHVAPASPVTTTLFNNGFVTRIAARQEASGDKADQAEIRRTFVERQDKDANILAPVEVQCQWLRELGFQDVDCFFKIHELALFGGRRPGEAALQTDEQIIRYRQSAAIPYRRKGDQLEVMVITSSKRKRWLVPKGLVEEDLTPWDSAAKEAYEEAGVTGQISDHCLGTYSLRKWGGICEVAVYGLEVTEQLSTWPEKKFRRRRWLPIAKAARLVQPKSLSRLLRQAIEELR